MWQLHQCYGSVVLTRRPSGTPCCRFKFPSLNTDLGPVLHFHTNGYVRIGGREADPRSVPRGNFTPEYHLCVDAVHWPVFLMELWCHQPGTSRPFTLLLTLLTRIFVLTRYIPPVNQTGLGSSLQWLTLMKGPYYWIPLDIKAEVALAQGPIMGQVIGSHPPLGWMDHWTTLLLSGIAVHRAIERMNQCCQATKGKPNIIHHFTSDMTYC